VRIYLENFSFDTIIGILPEERETPQKVIINLIADYNYSSGHFIDYVEIRDIIRELMDREKFGLLEDAIEEIICRIYTRFNIRYMKVKITKPDILEDAVVSLEKEWSDV
jgi:dihydroneopterin aldolase